jgi:hypothetical protein
MIYSLLENGLTKEDVVTALGRLEDEAAADEWRKVMEGRERARQTRAPFAVVSSARSLG